MSFTQVAGGRGKGQRIKEDQQKLLNLTNPENNFKDRLREFSDNIKMSAVTWN